MGKGGTCGLRTRCGACSNHHTTEHLPSQAVGQQPRLSIPATWGCRVEVGAGETRVHSHRCTSTRAHRVRSVYGARCACWTVCFFPSQSFSMVDCPRAQPGHGRDAAAGCAQSRLPEEMAPLFTTHPTGTGVTVTRGTKRVAFLRTSTLQASPLPRPHTSPWLLGRGHTQPRALKASVLEAGTLAVSSGVGCQLEGQGNRGL